MNKVMPVVLVASVGLLVALLGGGTEVPGAPPPPGTSRTGSRSAVLNTSLPEVQFASIPLAGAIDELRDRTHANIVVEWSELGKIGATPQSPVRVRLWDVTLSQALTIVLADVDENLGFQDEDGIITISTRQRLNGKTVMRIYDLQPLMETLTRRPNADRGATRQEIIDSVTKLIEDTVDVDSWKDNGGDAGTLRELMGLLIVQQTPSAQRRVEDLLEELQSGQGPHVVKLKQLTVRPGQ